MISLMVLFGWIFFGVGGAFILWQWFYVTCCPQHADKAAQQQMERQTRRQQQRNGGQQQQPQQQNMNRNSNTPQTTQYVPAPQQHVPVAQAHPVQQYDNYNNHNNNQRGAVQQVPQFQNTQQPQVVVHQPARTSNGQTGAAKTQDNSVSGQASATASKLFGKAKGMFGR